MHTLANPYIVIVTSSLHPGVGVIPLQDRVEQTVRGLEIIREKIPDCFIIVSDISIAPCDDAKRLVANKADMFIDFSGNQQNVELSKQGLRSHSELIMLKATFEWIKQELDLTNVKRIFKNSGRHTLTEEFNIKEYDNPEMIGKYVFKNSVDSWIKPGEWRLYEGRLWSMDATLIDHYLSVWQGMFNDCDSIVDIEHVYHRYLNPVNTIELPMIWVEGYVALNGKYQKD